MNTFKVGLLSLASIIAVVIMSLMITANQSGFGKHIAYQTVLTNAAGIFPKTSIKVAGINSGRIKTISLNGNEAIITLEIREDVVVTKGSYLEIRTVGVLGDKYIELRLDTSNKDRLKEGSFLKTKESKGLDSLAQDVGIVVTDVREMVKELKDSLMPEGSEKSKLKSFVDDISVAAKDAKILADTLKNIAVDNEQKLVAIIENLEKFSSELKMHVDATNEESLMADVKHVVANAEKITSDLQDIIKDVRDGKGTVGQFLADDGIADEVKETLSGVNKIVNKMNYLQTEIQVYSGADTRDGAVTDAELWLYTAPERYFIVGAKSVEEGRAKEKTKTEIVNGVPTVTEESTVKKDTFTFTAQIGRKFQNVYLNAGLIDSTAGFGFAYEFPVMGLKLGSDLFDFSHDDGMNLRLKAELHIWNVIYARAMSEATGRSDHSFTFSLGLRLLDDDLKGIIGLVI